MIRINLLPPDERQSPWQIQRIVLAGIITVLLLCTATYSYTYFRIWYLDNQITELQTQYQAQQSSRNFMLLANQKQQELDKKSGTLERLRQDRYSWTALLQQLTALTPANVWFADLSKGEKDTLVIQGYATTYPALADFLQKLENSGVFAEPTLIQAELEPKTTATKFQITVIPKGMY